MVHLYLGHPVSTYAGDPASLVAFWISDPARQGDDLVVHQTKYKSDSSLNAQDFCSVVLQAPGPVLLLKPIQARSSLEIVRRLNGRVPVYQREVYEMRALESEITSIVADYLAGEPKVALDVAVALLLMAKLDHNLMWAGNAKGYMWVDDLAKGRGVDEKYAPRVPVVVNILLQGGLLTFKTSKGTRKYALNPFMRVEIHNILESRKFSTQMETSLLRNRSVESVRALDRLREDN